MSLLSSACRNDRGGSWKHSIFPFAGKFLRCHELSIMIVSHISVILLDEAANIACRDLGLFTCVRVDELETYA